jgi:Domain of unknown function (DUF4920)
MTPRPRRLAWSALLLPSALCTALFSSACDKGPRSEAASAKAANAAAAGTAGAAAGATGAPATAAAGTAYGAGVKLAASTPIADILRDPKAFAGKTVRVEGRVSDVCEKRGCWMEVASEAAGEKIRFKVNDGEIVFPLEAKGQYALAEGVVAVNELTLEASRDYAKYQAEEAGRAFDPASVTAPTRIVRLDGVGAVLRNQK